MGWSEERMETPKEICENCKPLFEELQKRIIQLEQKNRELEKRLLAYENAHTPPSQQRKYPEREKSGRGIGALKGHEGATRPTPEPNKFEELKLDSCPNCNKRLGRPRSIQKKIIEDIPELQPLIITQFTIPHYFCAHCNAEVIPSHPDLPSEGKFGPNLQAEITLMKYEDRLPHKKIADALNRRYGLSLVPATVLDITRRVSDKLQAVYEAIKEEVKTSKQVVADETGLKVQGKNFWLWTFVSLTSTLFLIRKSRGQEPIKEALGKYKGIVTCDGWTSYDKVVKIIQRCWAHILRESKWYAEKYEEQAEIVYKGLCKLYKQAKSSLGKSQRLRENLYKNCIQKMQFFIASCKVHKGLRRFAKKLENGLEQWFTCILHPEIDMTSNKAERALREPVVQRKISSLWNEKGIMIKETIMSVLATWNLRGLNTYSMLRKTLSS